MNKKALIDLQIEKGEEASAFRKAFKSALFSGVTTNGEESLYTRVDSVIAQAYIEAGQSRGNSKEFIKYFETIYNDIDRDAAMRLLMHIRDIKGGKGEYGVVYDTLTRLIVEEQSIGRALEIMINLGSWKDMFNVLFMVFKACKEKNLEFSNLTAIKDVMPFILYTYIVDMFEVSENRSLFFKYFPINKRQNEDRKAFLVEFMHCLRDCARTKYPDNTLLLGTMNMKRLRKRIVEIRAELGIVETKLTNREYDKINYASVPNIARNKYIKAFMRNDGERYSEFVNKLSTGEITINTDSLDIATLIKMNKSMFTDYQNVLDDKTTTKYVNGVVEQLLEQNKDIDLSVLPIIDLSGSMWESNDYGVYYIYLAIAYGIIVSKLNKDTNFKNMAIGFSYTSSVLDFNSDNFLTNFYKYEEVDHGGGTRFEECMEFIAQTCRKAGLEQKDLPKYLLIFSDAQFDDFIAVEAHTRAGKAGLIEKVDSVFSKYGYKSPELIHWYLGSDRDNGRFFDNSSQRVHTISGYDLKAFDCVKDGKFPTLNEMVYELINQDKYDVFSDYSREYDKEIVFGDRLNE